MDEQKQSNKKQKFIRWIKRLGVWGFLFFLVKGLVWLAIGWFALKK